ncbi:hypothetical protein O181_075571 [Austropuccinia psidii MF-1]|uniref:Uncharacterized protein n=1 Tax=Austropuccinia psidii MF-1 TaxID=1389203 RepID=A0A9Q3IAB0_9BASI|nr:hypothetical protein [Austropuccinia psidii MF-1]
MRSKGDKGGSPLAPKPQLGPPEPNLASNLIKPKMAINHHRTHFGPQSSWTTFQPMAFGNHQRPPDQRSSSFPLTLRGILPILHAPHTQGCRSGAYMVLYTIMRHFCSAIQLMTFSGPNSIFPNQGPKIQRPFQRRIS